MARWWSGVDRELAHVNINTDIFFFIKAILNNYTGCNWSISRPFSTVRTAKIKDVFVAKCFVIYSQVLLTFIGTRRLHSKIM